MSNPQQNGYGKTQGNGKGLSLEGYSRDQEGEQTIEPVENGNLLNVIKFYKNLS
ncbi:MAG: hypothetical protein WCI11_07685 [Candidatus Methylumidiphilus sp.]